ncbi:hypothetical protein JOB18_011784 [Solea senegalensis]|uniref:Uncharacterized protein n=1 Tax=Solea senegalensis TaxID=28829 RepID=A0AAV6SFA6_SOLSE|nr:hypothetical protein JOB18_011784 [Solea senegalensis]
MCVPDLPSARLVPASSPATPPSSLCPSSRLYITIFSLASFCSSSVFCAHLNTPSSQ